MKKLKALIWLFVFILVGFAFSFIETFLKILAIPCVLFGKDKVKLYGLNVLVGYDNFASACTGGDPDETISSRLGKARNKGSGWAYIAKQVDLVAFEIFGDENHCEKSIEKDEGQQQVTTY